MNTLINKTWLCKWVIAVALISIFCGVEPANAVLKNVVEDTSPQLGGDLDGQSTYDLINIVDGTFLGTGTFGNLDVTGYADIGGNAYVAGDVNAIGNIIATTIEGTVFKAPGCTAGTGAVALGDTTTASGDYSMAIGRESTSGTIQATGIGSTAMGYCSGTGEITASAPGSTAKGYATGGAYIRSDAHGSIAAGFADVDGKLRAFGLGSVIMGYSLYASDFSTHGQGSIAMGYNNGAWLQSNKKGSIAMGCVKNGGSLLASGEGSVVMGYSDGGVLRTMGLASIAMGESVTADANNAISFGKGFQNNISDSFAVGFGQKDFVVKSGQANVNGDLAVTGQVTMGTLVIPTKDTTGDPASPVEGQIYTNTADNKVRIYTDGAWRDLATWL